MSSVANLGYTKKDPIIEPQEENITNTGINQTTVGRACLAKLWTSRWKKNRHITELKD